jgi:hypothetical protein
MSDIGTHGNPLPSRSVRLDSPSPLNPFGSVSCLHGKDSLEDQRRALETRQQDSLEAGRASSSGEFTEATIAAPFIAHHDNYCLTLFLFINKLKNIGMASRLGMAPRTPKPQTPNPVPAHKFLKRLSTQDMTASFRSSFGGEGEGEDVGSITTRNDDDSEEWDPSMSPHEHLELQIESRDLFDSMVQHQYSNDSDPFAETKKEMLIDNDGFPLLPGSPSPAQSPIKSKKMPKHQKSLPTLEDSDEPPSPSKQAKFNDSLERYIISSRQDIKPAREVGKTIGIPYVGVVVGSKPVRTHTSRHADSAEHLQYTKILTAADPPGTAPYSWVKIGADRRNEIERVRAVRQTPQYKLQKRNAQIYNRVYGMRAAMKHLPPRRFWDEWSSTVNQKYPDGIDQAPGCVSVPVLIKKEDPALKAENQRLARQREMAQLYGFVETKEMAMKKQKEIYMENKKHAENLEALEKEKVNSDKNARRDKRIKEKKLNEKFHKQATAGGNSAAVAISNSRSTINVNTLIGCKGGQSVGDKFVADALKMGAGGGRKGLTFH